MKANLKVLLLGITALLLLAVYALSDVGGDGDDAVIKKADFLSLYTMPDSLESRNAVTLGAVDSTLVAHKTVSAPDTSRNILFVGDSMLEGLCRRFIDYADQNAHTLNTVIWYSSSTKLWADTDTLNHFIKKFNPDYIVVCLGGNELFVKDIDKRKKYIQTMVSKIGNIPFVWISPPNWKPDTGINDAIISVVGRDRYFDSRTLELERGSDHRHPTYPAAALWMDTIARWMQSSACAHPIAMEWPENDLPPRNVTMLAPSAN